MNFGVFKKLFDSVGDYAKKHAPEILAGVGIAGFITTAVLAAKATPDALDAIEDAKDQYQTEDLTLVQKVKAGYKPYLPAIVTGVSSTACVIGSVSTSLRRNAALVTTCEITRNFADEYRKKVVEEIGEKKEKKIRENLAHEQINNNPPISGVNVIPPRHEHSDEHLQLFYESLTKRYFWAKRSLVEKICNKCFNEIRNAFENQYSVYSWLRLLNEYGINIMDGLPDGEVDKWMDQGWPSAKLDSCEVMEVELVDGGIVSGGEWDGYSCIKIDYSEQPSYDFRSGY